MRGVINTLCTNPGLPSTPIGTYPQTYPQNKCSCEQVFGVIHTLGRTGVRANRCSYPVSGSPELFGNILFGWGAAYDILSVNLLWIDLSKRDGLPPPFLEVLYVSRWWKGTEMACVWLDSGDYRVVSQARSG